MPRAPLDDWGRLLVVLISWDTYSKYHQVQTSSMNKSAKDRGTIAIRLSQCCLEPAKADAPTRGSAAAVSASPAALEAMLKRTPRVKIAMIKL